METFIRSQEVDEQRLCSLIALGNFSSVVLTTGPTNVMLALQLTAIGAFLIGSTTEGIVRPAHVAPRFRNLLLGNSHFQHLKSNVPNWTGGSYRSCVPGASEKRYLSSLSCNAASPENGWLMPSLGLLDTSLKTTPGALGNGSSSNANC